MLFSKPEMLTLVIDQSTKAEIDPALACSVVHVLSAWMPAMINHSPNEMIPGFDLPEHEANGQQATFGLFQFTGMQARQAGYKGGLNDLLDPSQNIPMGVEILRNSLRVTPKLETGLIVYLGRGRALMTSQILWMVEPYERLITQRPNGTTGGQS